MGNICDHTKGRGGEFAGDEVVREKRVDLENELVGMWRARAAELHAMKESGEASSRAAGPQGEEGAKQTAAAVPALTKSDERDLAAYLTPTVDAMLRKEIEDHQSFDFLSSPRLPSLGLMTTRPSMPVPRVRAMNSSSPAAGGGDSNGDGDGDGDSGGGGGPLGENSGAPSAGAAATGGGGGGGGPLVIDDVRGHLRSMDAPGLAALLEQARRERIETRKQKKHESQNTDDGEVPVRTLLFGDAESSPALPPPLTPPARPRRLKPSGAPPDLANLKT